MANSFKQYIIIFDATAKKVTGETVLRELNGFIDTDSADVKVDENHVEVRFVTIEAQDHIFKMCDEVKQKLDKASNERLFYKVMVISL